MIKTYFNVLLLSFKKQRCAAAQAHKPIRRFCGFFNLPQAGILFLTLWGYSFPKRAWCIPCLFGDYIMSNQVQNVPAYFDLTADGVGFMNRPRVVQGKRGSGHVYFSCTIQALHGDADEKARFDVRIVGGKAKELFAKLLEEFPDLLSSDYKRRPTVFIGFRVGDLHPVVFETNSKNDKNEPVKVNTPSIDARLLKFKFIKVNRQVWYTEKKRYPSPSI
jgi:hypothetical protein